jgi:hypothetical protein
MGTSIKHNCRYTMGLRGGKQMEIIPLIGVQISPDFQRSSNSVGRTWNITVSYLKSWRKSWYEIVGSRQRNNVHTKTEALCARIEDKFRSLTLYKAHNFCAHFPCTRANYSLKGAESKRFPSYTQIFASCGVYF